MDGLQGPLKLLSSKSEVEIKCKNGQVRKTQILWSKNQTKTKQKPPKKTQKTKKNKRKKAKKNILSVCEATCMNKTTRPPLVYQQEGTPGEKASRISLSCPTLAHLHLLAKPAPCFQLLDPTRPGANHLPLTPRATQAPFSGRALLCWAAAARVLSSCRAHPAGPCLLSNGSLRGGRQEQ